jgi:hypothetical protein
VKALLFAITAKVFDLRAVEGLVIEEASVDRVALGVISGKEVDWAARASTEVSVMSCLWDRDSRRDGSG